MPLVCSRILQAWTQVPQETRTQGALYGLHGRILPKGQGMRIRYEAATLDFGHEMTGFA